MSKRNKDRAFISASEWASEWGGCKDRASLPFNRLPFHCCGLTFTPFEDPVCTDEGLCFDIVNIVPYIKKHKRHPVSGAPLELRDLTRLHFHKNADGEYHCPVLNKVFTESTHIVAIKTTGNVFSYQAVEELNIRPKNWKDLLTDEPFTRKDILVIQDPLNLSGRTLDQFDHVRNQLSATDQAQQSRGANVNAALSGDMARALKHLDTDAARAAFEAGGGGRAAQAERMLAAAKQAAAPACDAPEATGVIGLDAPLAVFKPGTHTWNSDAPAAGKQSAQGGTTLSAAPAPGAARAPAAPEVRPSAARAGVVGSAMASMRSNGMCAASFTSSAMAPVMRNEAATAAPTARKVARKAYVALHTSHGDLNLELHADLVPRACENFLLLAARGFYDGVAFHRSIRNFMIQGGDPTGTGTGGQSAWGRPFVDEFNHALSHDGRGVVAMANSGPHSNGSQFFVLFKSAPHLDNKHTVFGRVVGGVETTLSAMERVPTDKDDRPAQPIKITGVTVFDDPFLDAEPEAAAAAGAEPEAAPEPEEPGLMWSAPGASKHSLVAQHGGVGKFVAALKPAAAPAVTQREEPGVHAAKRPKPSTFSFGDFSAW